MVGAAIATIVAEPIGAGLMFYYASRRGLSIIPLRRLRPAVLAAILMAATLAAIGTDSLIVQLVIGIAVYATALFLMGCVKFESWLPTLKV